MERLWSLVGATSGNRRQMPEARNRPRQAKTVATGCDQLPLKLDGKEGVDGSSPSEGSAKAPESGRFSLGSVCTSSSMQWVWSRLWIFQGQNVPFPWSRMLAPSRSSSRSAGRFPRNCRDSAGGSRTRTPSRGPLSYRRYLAPFTRRVERGQERLRRAGSPAGAPATSPWACRRSSRTAASGCDPDRRRRALLLHARRGGGQDREPRLRPVSARPGPASEIVREYFDSDRSSPGCSPTPSTASQRTDALRARCTGASGVKRPLPISPPKRRGWG